MDSRKVEGENGKQIWPPNQLRWQKVNIFTAGNDSKDDNAEMGDSPSEIKP